jgi:uncharacterized protein YndB with AHSA1/START domain
MSFVAEAERTFAAPPETVFDSLANHDRWASFMPKSFRPVGEGAGTLAIGKRLRVKVGGAPIAVTIEISAFDRPREIGWKGGALGLYADHRFYFEDDGKGGTRVRSVETWSGPMAPLARPLVKPRAEMVGRDQLAGLQRALDQK